MRPPAASRTLSSRPGVLRAAGAAAAAVIGAAVLGAAIAPAALAAQAAPKAAALPVHATLVTTSPANGAVVSAEPGRVTAGFDQPVGISSDSLIVYTPGGQRADTGGTQHPRPDEIAVTLTPGLGQGTFTAEWHVASADSHEVQGAFTFSVGATSATNVPPLRSSDATLVATLYAVARWLEYAFFALLAGAVAFLIICWPSGARREGVPGLVIAGWIGLACSTLAALLLQGPYSQNVRLGLLLNPALELTTLHTRLGTALQARQVLAVLAAILATALLRRLPRMTARARVAAGTAWAVLVCGLAATWAVADHASTGFQVPLAIGVDIAHLTAMSLWLGGLVMLVAFTLRGPSNHAAALAVRRFSPIALGCVAVLAASGGYMAWRLIGTWGALFGTTYGLLVIAKSAGLAILVGLGYLARRFIHRNLLRISGQQAAALPAAAAATAVQAARPEPGADAAVDGELALATVSDMSAPLSGAPRGVTAGDDRASDTFARGSGGVSGEGTASDAPRGGASPGDDGPGVQQAGDGRPAAGPGPRLPSMRDLRLSVAVEVCVVALVLAATAVLVNTATGRESYAPAVNTVQRFDTGAPNGSGTVDVTVTPARLGGNQVTLTFDTLAGRAYVPAHVQAALFLPARNVGPLPVPLSPAGPGRYQASGVTFTFTGQWQLRIAVRGDDFDETSVFVSFTVHQ